MSAQVGRALARSAPSERRIRQRAVAQCASEWRLPLATVSEVASMFALLGDPTRVSVLYALAAAGELRVSDLAGALERDASTMSHQLRVLRDHHLVTYEKRGRATMYRLADSHVLTLFQQALAHAAHQTPTHAVLADASAVGEVH
jgi:ArsR family transcriptional regulator, lead/cadmium/zinc/bismuth-responsive transcriptional repressor